jgi:hypothetical protein
VGDPPQVCFRTTVATACTATSVSDTAGGSDTTGSFTSNTVSLRVAPGASCQPNVTVDKEICASHADADCGPGGAGPWVKQAPVGILGLLLAHPRWRITVTDHGPVDAASVRVNDSVEPGCVSAAGLVAAGEIVAVEQDQVDRHGDGRVLGRRDAGQVDRPVRGEGRTADHGSVRISDVHSGRRKVHVGQVHALQSGIGVAVDVVGPTVAVESRRRQPHGRSTVDARADAGRRILGDSTPPSPRPNRHWVTGS